ncbi:MAG: hypothetical protein IPM64_17410 [Phycisphaerales bacterium]|nr:hypothetical protein [Phycisphaerales bacterium]
MSEISRALRAAADLLSAEAAKYEDPAAVPAPGSNIFAGVSVPWADKVPPEFRNPAHPYGARPDIGSPGYQVSMREYARMDGKEDRNAYLKDRGFTPIWPDTKQNWEA